MSYFSYQVCLNVRISCSYSYVLWECINVNKSVVTHDVLA